MLRFINFHKSYNRLPVLSIQDATIQTGIHWVRGANGSGKSTFLRSIAGILHFNGDIILDAGISLKKDAVAYRRLVNFADAEPVFPEFLTGSEMIKLFLDAKEIKQENRDHLIESMGLKHFISDPIATYSTGTLKKLSLILAFIGDAKVILLDEPLITLDSQSLNALYEWIEHWHTKIQTSFIISSHQPLRLAEHIPVNCFTIKNQTLIQEA